MIQCSVAAIVMCGWNSQILAAGEAATVTVTLDAAHPGAVIPSDFSGLSFEVSLLLPSKNGVRYFRPDNLPLIQLFHTLGIKSLRVGGNMSDRNATQLPGPADWDSLFAFAKAANVKVIYGLQLYHGDPQVAASTVKYIMDRYAPLVEAFAIGQEPSAYPVTAVDQRAADQRMGPGAEKFTYSAYAKEWKRFADAIVAAVPDVKFSGPGVHDDARWAKEFIADFGRGDHVALITEHLYPGGAGGKVPTPEIGRSRMLDRDFVKTYQKLSDGLAPVAASSGLPYRLEEVNNFFNGGAMNVSDTFASALWGLDFMYWWAEHGAAGLNFHTGDRVAAGGGLNPSKYTAFFSTEKGFTVRPLGYGIKAFDLGSQGRLVPVTVSNSDNLNLSLYAVLGEDGNLYITAINKENGATARSANLIIQANSLPISTAQVMSLVSPGNDIAAGQGQTLGGAEIKEDGSWDGKWTPLSGITNGVLTLPIPAASACVIKLAVAAKN